LEQSACHAAWRPEDLLDLPEEPLDHMPEALAGDEEEGGGGRSASRRKVA
jgi:hypothetical protein